VLHWGGQYGLLDLAVAQSRSDRNYAMLNDTLSLDFNDAARRPMGRPNCLSLLCCTIESENAKQQPCVPFWEIMALDTGIEMICINQVQLIPLKQEWILVAVKMHCVPDHRSLLNLMVQTF